MQSTQNIDLDKLYNGKSEKKDTISNQEETSKTPINLDSLYNPHKEPTSLETEQSKYDVGYVLPETNTLEALNEHRAQRQSALDKVANGTVKMLGTAVQSTVEPFTNLTLGLGMALAKGELNPIYDNPASRGLDSMNKFLQEKFPNYYSKAEQDYNLAQELKTVNFWADKVGNGVGFMAGAIASGLASGAVSAKLFNSISKLAIGESLGQTFSAGEKAINVLEDLNKTSKLVRLSDNATQAISGLTGAIGESGMEARQIKDQTIKALKDQRDKGLNNLSDKDIEDQADAAGNIGFGFNMAIVGGSNIIQFGKLFTGAANNEIKTFNKISRQSGKFIVEEPTSGLVKTLESPITEATQEQLQQAIQSGVTNYYERKNDKDAKDSVDNLIQATIYGLEQAYGTKSGWEQALIGGLLGGAGHLATMSKENKIEVQKQANTQALVDQLNNYKLSDSFKPLYEAAVRHTSFENTKQIALKNNDIFAYQNAHTGQFFSYIQSRIDANKFESVLEDLNQVKNLSKDQFKKDFGFDENTPLPKPVHQFVNDLILKAKEVNRLSESIDNKFPNLHPDLKQQLKFTAYSISDIDNREASLSSKLAVLTKGKIAYDAERFADKTNYKETLGKKLDEVKINPADKQEIETILEDLGKLLGRREGFIEAYNKLSDPKFQKDEQERIEKKAKEEEGSRKQEEVKPVSSEPAQTEEVTESIDLTPTVESVADKIKKGETEFTPEELQLQQNESEALEKELKKPTISDIEAKKADIERRRLKSINEVEEVLFNNGSVWHGHYYTGRLSDRGRPLAERTSKLTKEEVIKELNTKYDAELTALGEENVANIAQDGDNESSKNPLASQNEQKSLATTHIEEDPNIINTQSRLEDNRDQSGKKKITYSTIEAGPDDGSDESADRYYRFVNNNNPKDFKGLLVTQKNNEELFNEILKLDSRAKKFVEKTPEYEGIWMVITKDGKPVKENDKLVFGTLTKVEAIENNRILYKTDEERDKAIQDLTEFRRSILDATEDSYVNFTDKSKGHAQFEKTVNGLRQSHSVIGRLANSLNEVSLELPVVGVNGSTTAFLSNGQIANTGKLYARNKEGNIVDLIPRFLSEEEQNKVFHLVLQKVGAEERKSNNISEQLGKLIYFGLKKGSEPTDYTLSQVWSPSGYEKSLIFIGKERVNKNILETEEGQNKLKEFLKTKRVNVNSRYGFEDKFTDIFGKEHDSYKDYLLEGENPLFGTDLVKNTEVQFKNQYFTYDPTLKTKELKGDSDNKRTFTREGSRSLDRLKRIIENKTPLVPKEEQEWFKSNFPNIPIEIVKGLIENKSFGRFLSAGKILLSDEATIGTLYHEAFHVISQMYLSQKELSALYKETKEKTGAKTDLEAEEELAEEFIEYKKSGRVIGGRYLRNDLFRKILNFIKDLLRLPVNSIEDIYRRIDKGYYKNKATIQTVRFRSLDRSKLTVDRGVEFEKEAMGVIGAFYYDIMFTSNKTPSEFLDNEKLTNALFNRVFDELNKEYTNETNLDVKDNLTYILENFDSVIGTFIEKSKANGIDIKIDEEIESSEDELLDNKETNDSAYQEANLVSTRSVMNDSVWALITGLKQVNKEGEFVLSKLFNQPQTVNPTTTYNYLLKHLSGLSTYEELFTKLTILKETRPELEDLIYKLGEPSSSNTYAQQLLQNQFRQDFGKNRMTSHKTILEADGVIYEVDANNENNAGRIKDKWENNLLNSSHTTEDGKITIDLNKVKFGNPEAFLQSIGLNLSEETITQSKEEDKFITAVTSIQNYIRNNKGDITTLFKPTKEEKEAKKDVYGNIKYLTQLEADNNPDSAELSFISTEGKTVYSIGYNNALSIIKNIINNSKTLQEVYQRLPHLNTISTEGSVYLSELFDSQGNKRKDRTLQVDLRDGLATGVDSETEYKASTRKLSAGDKWVQEINSILLYGRSSYIRASDKSSEHSIYLNKYGRNKNLYISIEDLKSLDNKDLKTTFQRYFKSELKRVALHKVLGFGLDLDVFDKQGSKFSVFEDILSGETKKSINEALENLKKEDLSQEQLLERIEDLAPTFDQKIADDTEVFFVKYSEQIRNELKELRIGKSQGISKEFEKYSLEQLTNTIAVNDFINSVEQTKLFLGDMVFYKDLFKRTSSLSGTKQTAANSPSINNWLNNNFTRLDNKVENGEVNVVVFEDVTQSLQSELLNSYTNTLIESGVSEDKTKEILTPYTSMDEGDAQGWITLDEYRSFWTRLGKEIPQDIFEKAQKGEVLNKDEMYYFTSIKAQQAGPQKYGTIFAPSFHKFSSLPILPSMVKGKNLETLLETMTKNQIGYALFKSGSKVGTRVTNEKANKFYIETNNGQINTENWQKQTIFYDFLGLQTETSQPKEKVIFGTQFKKLLFSNQFAEGKEIIKGTQKLLDRYNSIIDRLVQKEKSKLIKKLGINPETYNSEDVRKLVDLLQEEAKQRNLADNLIDGLQSVEDSIIEGKYLLKYKFDAMVTKTKIDSMLMSLVESRLIRQKITGDALIQVASSGFEDKGDRKVGNNETLETYRKDPKTGKTLPAEVMIPLSKEYSYLLEKYSSLKALNEAIKSQKVDKKELQLVGYRIPTQGFNSMEFFEIAEFLPTESSTSIVVPTTIVAKSGSDFDIDKLNIIKRSEMSSELMDIAIEILSNPDNFAALITPNSSSILKDLANEIRFIEHLNEKPDPELDRSKFETQEAYEKAYNEKKNTYIKNREQSLKSNIRYTNQLKLSGKEGKIAQFTKFMTAKDMIGIAAIHNTHNILAQTHNLTIDGKQVSLNLPANKVGDDYTLAKQKDIENRHQISEIISQILTASVDAAKDPFMFDINLTMETLGTALYLTRVGVPFETVGYFLSQPIISDYLHELSVNKSGFLKAIGEDYYRKELIAKVKKDYGELPKDYKPIVFSESQLKNNLSDKTGKDFNNSQLQILDDFLSYQEQSQMLSDAIRATNMDTSGVGKNLNSIQAKLDLIEKAKKDNFVKGIDKILENSIVKSFNQLEFTKQVYSQFYYTQESEFVKVKQDLLNEINPFGDKAKDKLVTLIENDLINYIIQNYGYINTKELKTKLFRTESVAKKILDLKNKKNKTVDEQKIAENLLIKELQPLLTVKKNKDNNLKTYTKRLDIFTSNQLTEAFRALKELDPSLAKEIMDLGILQSGLNNSPITYLGLIPFEYYNDLTKRAFENYKKNGVDIEDFKPLFLANNGYFYDSKGRLKQGKPSLGSGMFGKDYTETVKETKPRESKEIKQIEGSNESNEPQFSKKINEGLRQSVISKFHQTKEQAEAALREIKDLLLGSYVHPVGDKWKVYAPVQKERSNQFPQQSIGKGDNKIHEQAFIELADKLKTKNQNKIDYKLASPEELLAKLQELGVDSQAAGITKDNVQGFYDNKGQIWFNRNELTAELAFHEFSHPFVDAITDQNKPLFSNLKRNLQDTESGKSIIAEVKKEYPWLVEKGELIDKGWKETITTALGRMAENQLDSTKDKSLIDSLKQLLKRISEYLTNLFSDPNKIIKPVEITPTTTLEELASILNLENKIDLSASKEGKLNYNLKSIEFLSSPKATQLFDKWFKTNKDKFYQEITQFAGKEQLQLIKDIVTNENPQTIGDLFTSLLANYSYTVEINVATTKLPKGWNEDEYNQALMTEFTQPNTWLNEETGQIEIVDKIESSYEAPEATELKSTQHYSNLTVPGGTNYTENEISTPLITPSIKGHAQFSTNNGIGWFRSDEQSKIENTGDVRTGVNYLGEPITFDTGKEVGTKTRRILEVQSDLFQKGRDKSNLVPHIGNIEEEAYYNPDTDEMVIHEPSSEAIKKNNFLQLLNKDNNWVTFFVKSIIQDSAKKGYEKVLFPSGETAAKVEGHETLNQSLIQYSVDIDNLNSLLVSTKDRDSEYANGESFSKEGDKYFISDGGGNIEITKDRIVEEIKKIESKKQELKSQGIEKLKPIEAFYEVRVTNILKKLGDVKTITDEYGNTWNEVAPSNLDIQLKKRTPKTEEENIVEPEPHINPFTQNKTNPSTTEVLQNIINDPNKNEAGSELTKFAEKLLQIQDKNKTVTLEIVPEFTNEFLREKGIAEEHISDDSTINGFWSPKENKIYISENIANHPIPNNFKKVFLHELIHSYTNYPFGKNQEELTQEEKKFINDITQLYEIAKTETKNKDLYGYTNVQEFISEIMTSPKFVRDVKSLNPDLSIWQKLINTIVEFLTGKSIYDKSIEVITNYVDNLDKVNPSNVLLAETRPYKTKKVKTEEEKKAISESPFKTQYVFYKRRLAELNKQLKTAKQGIEQNKIEEEIATITDTLEKANKEQSKELYKELAIGTLDTVSKYIDILEAGKGLTDENIKFVSDVLDSFREFPEGEIRGKVFDLEQILAPVIQDYAIKEIQTHATEKFAITQDIIDKQTEDIGDFKKWVGSLSDSPNYFVRTVGSVIKIAQNIIASRDKHDKDIIVKEIDKLESWAKKNGLTLERAYNIFIQPRKGSTGLTQQYYESGNENPNWNRIQNTPELKQFYHFYQDFIEKAQENLSVKLGKNFIPNIRKSTLKNKVKSLVPEREWKKGELVGSEDLYADILNTEYAKKLSEEDKSRDLGAILLEFKKYSNRHEEMSNILPKVRILQRAITKKINSNGVVIDREFINANNPKTSVKGIDSNAWKMVEDVINMQVFGEMKKLQIKIKYGTKFNEQGNPTSYKYIAGSDIIDVLLKGNSLLRIGFSPVTAAANLAFGTVTNRIEAIGGRFFGNKDLFHARNIFFKQTLDKDSVLNKVLIEDLNILQDLEDYGQIADVSLKSKLSPEKIQEYAYGMQKSGEKWIQSESAMAVMIKDGYLTTSGELTEKYNKATEEEKQELIAKIHRLNQLMHGRYSQQEAATLQQSVYYRMFIQFKKWIPAAIEARFGEKQYDNRLQVETEGRYRTFFKLVTSLKNTIERLNKGNLTELEIYNMKKNLTDITLLVAMGLAYAGLHGDDDKAKQRRKMWQVKLGLTLLNRVSGDIASFGPQQLTHTGANLIPIVKSAETLLQTVQLLPTIFDQKEAYYKTGSRKGQHKFLTKFGQITPGVKPILDIYRIANKYSLEELR